MSNDREGLGAAVRRMPLATALSGSTPRIVRADSASFPSRRSSSTTLPGSEANLNRCMVATASAAAPAAGMRPLAQERVNPVGSSRGSTLSHGAYAAINAAYPIALLVNQIVDELLVSPPPLLRATGLGAAELKQHLVSRTLEVMGAADGPSRWEPSTLSTIDQARLTAAFRGQAAWGAFEAVARRTCKYCGVGGSLVAHLLRAVRLSLGLPEEAAPPALSSASTASSVRQAGGGYDDVDATRRGSDVDVDGTRRAWARAETFAEQRQEPQRPAPAANASAAPTQGPQAAAAARKLEARRELEAVLAGLQ